VNFQTKYDIGHTFWAPRCRVEYDELELVWEGETWTRKVPKYVAYAKEKEIVQIHIKHDDRGTQIQYACVDIGKPNDLSQWYHEDRITEYSQEEALEIAEKYVEKKEEYFGN
jgi:hypothetical protein